MRKYIIIITIILLIASQSFAFITALIQIPSLLMRLGASTALPGLMGATRTAVGFVGSATVAGGAGYLIYNNITYEYQGLKTFDEQHPTDTSGSGSPENIVYGGWEWMLNTNIENMPAGCNLQAGQPPSYKNMTYNGDGSPQSLCVTYFVPGNISCTAVSTNPVWSGRMTCYNAHAVAEPSSSGGTAPGYSDTLPAGAVPYPFVLDIAKGIDANVDLINDALAQLGVSIQATKQDVLDIVKHLPATVLAELGLTGAEQAYIDAALAREYEVPPMPVEFPDNITVNIPPITFPETMTVEQAEPIEIAEPETLPTVDGLEVPEIPIFDTELEIPETPVWIEPIQNFIDNVVGSIPFIAVVSSANIESTGGSSSVVFTVYGSNFTVDFADYSSVFTFMSTVLVFCSSVFSVFIIVKD